MSIIRKEQLSNPLSASYALTASFALNAGGSSIDTGSLVTISSFNAYTASINNFTSSYNTGSFSGSFTGNLSGTASYALNSNPPFPYTGSARITGSLDVIGNVSVTGSLLISGSSLIVSSSQFEMPNNIIVNSTTRRLNSGSTLSVDWGTRTLHTSTNSTSVNWNTLQLINPQYGLAVDWNNYFLKDASINTSIDWSVRSLYTLNGVEALTWYNDYVNYSNTYLYRFYNQDTQNNFALSVQYSGETINAAVSSSAVQYQLVSLSGSYWLPTNQTTDTSTKMLGIALNVQDNPTKGIVLLEGDITWDGSDGAYIHPGITSNDKGTPVYIRNTANQGQMSIIPPVSGYVRIVGYVYYEDSGTYIFKFKPSNDWYKLS